MLTTRSLSYQYSSGEKIIFPDVNVNGGEHTLLLGDSGSGKTTLLHLLAGFLKIQEGEILIASNRMNDLSESQRDHFRGKNIGIVFQKNHLINALTVSENILSSSYFANIQQKESRLKEVSTQLQIDNLMKKRPAELSHGQAQRVAIARAIINEPKLILADEPTSALDDHNCNRVVDLLLNVAHQFNATLFISTHDHRLRNFIKNVIVLKR